MTDVLELGIQVTGDEQAIADLQRVRGAQQQVAQQGATQAAAATQQAARVAQASRTQGAALTGLARNWGQVGSAIGQVGGVVGHLSPQMGALGSIVGQVGGAVTSLTGAMGPIGIAIAAVTTAVGLASAAFELFGARAEQAAQRTTHAREALESMNDVQLRQQELTEALANLNRIRSEGSDDEFVRASANVRNLRTALAAEQEREAARVAAGQAEERREAERERAGNARNEFERENARVLEEQNAILAEQEGIEREREQSAQRAAAAQQDRLRALQQLGDAVLDDLGALTEEIEIRSEMHAEEHEAQGNRLRELYSFWQELDGQTTEQILENRNRLHEKETELADRNKENIQARADQAKRDAADMGETTEGAFMAVGSSMQSFLGDVLSSIQEGNELTGEGFLRLLDRFLEATAIEYTLKALAEGGNAIAAAARYDYAAAAQHGVAAGIYGAVAALTGIAGAAISVPKASGAGGPAAVPQGAGGQGGTTNYTIQIYSPNAVFTETERAQIIGHGMRELRRQHGPAAART